MGKRFWPVRWPEVKSSYIKTIAQLHYEQIKDQVSNPIPNTSIVYFTGCIVSLGFLRRINSISVIQRRQFTNPCFLDYFSGQNSTSSLSWHWRASLSAIPIFLNTKGGKPLLPVLKTLVFRGRGSNPRPPETDALTIRPPRRSSTAVWRKFLRNVLRKNLGRVDVQGSSLVIALYCRSIMGRLKLYTIQSRLWTTLKKTAFENMVGKGENAGNQHFLLFSLFFFSLLK